MLNWLSEEILLHSELNGASKEIIIDFLNKAVNVEGIIWLQIKAKIQTTDV